MSGVSKDTAYEDMLFVKLLFGKSDGRQYLHWILSHDSDVTEELADIVCKEVLALLHGKYQVISATHLNTDNIHSHFLINPVDIVTGKKFSESKREMLRFRDKINRIMLKYGLNPVRSIQSISEEKLDIEDGNYNVMQIYEDEMYCGNVEIVGETLIMPGVMYACGEVETKDFAPTFVPGVIYDDLNANQYFMVNINDLGRTFYGHGYVDEKGTVYFPGILYEKSDFLIGGCANEKDKRI